MLETITEDYTNYYFEKPAEAFDIWYTLLPQLREAGHSVLVTFLIHGINIELKERGQEFRIGPLYTKEYATGLVLDGGPYDHIHTDSFGIYTLGEKETEDGVKVNLAKAMDDLRWELRIEND